jgi:hypothetical protein
LLLQQVSTLDENGQMVVKGTKVSRVSCKLCSTADVASTKLGLLGNAAMFPRCSCSTFA